MIGVLGIKKRLKLSRLDSVPEETTEHTQTLRVRHLNNYRLMPSLDSISPVRIWKNSLPLRNLALSVVAEAMSISAISTLRQVNHSIQIYKSWSPQEKQFCRTGVGGGVDPTCSPGTARMPATASPEFKAWFAGSKVVDRSGAPLVVYRGAASAKTEFQAEF